MDKERRELQEEAARWEKEYKNANYFHSEAYRLRDEYKQEAAAAKDALKEEKRQRQLTEEELRESLRKAEEEGRGARKAAVEEFKASQEYKDAVKAASIVVFDQAISLYRKDLLELYPDLNLAALDKDYGPFNEEDSGAEDEEVYPEGEDEHGALGQEEIPLEVGALADPPQVPPQVPVEERVAGDTEVVGTQNAEQDT